MIQLARVVAVLCFASVVASAGTPKVQISTHRKTVEIRDEAWGITAFRMEIPDNWTFEGVLLRDPSCGGVPTVAYRIASPDGLAGYQSMPTFVSHWSDDAMNLKIYRQYHCKTMEVLSPSEYLSYLAPSIRPNPTLGPIQPTVDAAQIDAMMAKYNDRLKAAHMAGGETGGGVHSRIEYTFHGHLIEENLRVVVSTFQLPTATRHWQWNTSVDVLGLRAPKGQLEDVGKVLGPMLASANFTPEWIARQQRKMAQDNERALALIRKQGEETSAMLRRNHEAYMKQSQESFEHSQQADRDRQDAMHRSAVAWTLYAGDEQLVRNPQTGTVSRITNQHGTNAHQDASSGDIVVSEDPNFDPSYYIRGNWTQLENVDPNAPR